jgi:ATP adenylyltransferase
MERLWAPWRAAYLTGHAGGGAGPRACIFCDKVGRGPAHFAEELILGATAEAFVIMNLYPYISGHVMVVPRAHVRSPADLPAPAHDALWRLVTASTSALRAALAPEGVNVGMNLGRVAGAGIDDHCHVHLVPRWSGDNNFMPVLGETRVISQDLQETYAALLPHFAPLFAGAPSRAP